MNSYSSYAALGLVLVMGILFVRNTLSSSTVASPEPPIAASSVPVVGHLFGLMRRKFEYYVDLSRRTASPVFTVFLPGQKIYVVTQPDLIQQVQKQHKALSFDPVVLNFIRAALQPSKACLDILNKNLSHVDGADPHMDIRETMRQSLLPGPDINQMNQTMIEGVSTSLNGIVSSRDNTGTLDLYAWLKDKISIATTDSVYGPHNPFRDPEVLHAFWKFDTELMKVILLPQTLARTGSTARDMVSDAFDHYYSSGYHEQASLLTRTRWYASTENGITLKDTARLELSGALAFLVNTIPMVFWILFRVYSEPGLLDELRKEIDPVVDTSGKNNGETNPNSYHLDLSRVKKECPLLYSVYRETLRLHAMGMTVREVTEDTLLGSRYMLKAGALVQMPTRVLHTDPSIWGADASEFRPRRFMEGETHTTSNGKLPGDVCYRAFGGGKTLCPGRHFATNEVIAVAATFVARYDMQPIGNDGKWSTPPALNSSIATAIMTPDHDINVKIMERQNLEGGEWHIHLSDSDFSFNGINSVSK